MEHDNKNMSTLFNPNYEYVIRPREKKSAAFDF